MLVVTDENVTTITGAEPGVLILAEDSCGACRSYVEDVQGLEQRGRLEGIVIGKMVLDKPGSGGFKRDNPWLREVEVLPYTAVYERGAKVDEFAASRGSFLMERLVGVEVVPPD